MTKRLKFTVGNISKGYKTIEIFIDSGEATYKILRSGLLDVAVNKKIAAQISDDWLKELDTFAIFSWDKNYYSDIPDGSQWELIFDDGKEIYRGRGSNAYPESWERFLDWLDALIPELEFVNRKRLEKVTLTYEEESLTLDRREKTLTIDKENSRHIYDAGDDIKKFLDTFQKFLDDVEFEDADASSRISFEILRHDGSTETFDRFRRENFLPELTNLLEEIHGLANDLTAKIFSPELGEIVPRQGKYIFCKVKFDGSYKHYTYRAEDETLAVGDLVDVPVGKNNDVTQARIVEIGYFEEYEAPFPIDKIKKIIGKHVATEWENY